ncbi:virulence metalloprotease-like [Haliotis cracherodii]|uniref:virulence metalloprotease-like n=1 Tax=Haliotis cracherodii TaxID=6455 RepID=UPI0039EC25C0
MQALILAVIAALCHVMHVDAAQVLDANIRFRYSLHRNGRQAYRHPTLASLLGLPRDVTLEVVDTITTVHGAQRRRYRELYKGMPVIGSSIEADVDDNGRYDGGAVTGTLILSMTNDIPNPGLCQLTEQEAQDTLLQGEGLALDIHILRKEIVKKIFVDNAKKAHLVFATDILVELPEKESRPYYLIDRCDGSVLKKSKKMSTMFNPREVSMTSTQDWGTGETTLDWGTGGTTLDWGTGETTLDWGTGSTDNWFSPSPSGNTNKVSPVSSTDTVSSPTTPSQKVTTAPVTAKPGEKCATFVKGTGGNPKTGAIVYSTPPYCLDVRVEGDMCFLENKYVKVVDLKQTKNEEKTEVVSFKCSDGYNDAINEATNPVLDALFYGTATFKMFEDWYNTKPLNIQPFLLVHYGNMIDNAFWNGQKMLFGDGSQDQTYPLVGLDVIGHELAHGVTEQNSGLEYSGQSGGIDEAFSDIAGEVVEAYVRKTDWLVGFDLSKSKTEALRYFKDPTRDGSSIKDAKNFESDMDVHFSSGVFNHAFYQIVEVGKIPIKYAFEGFLIANKVYWKEDTGFVDGACSTIRGAYDAGLDTEIYAAAFTAVGVNACPLTKFLQLLTPSKQRSNIRVSSIRQPLFGIKTIDTTKKIVVEAVSVSGAAVKLALSRTVSRSNPAASGTGRVELTVSGIALYYVRVFTDSADEISDVKITLKLE